MSGLKEGVGQYGKEIATAENKTNSFSSTLKSAVSGIAELSVVAAAAGATILAMIQKYGGFAYEMEDLSLVTGLSVKELQQMKYAAMLSGNTLESVTPGLNKLTLSMSEFTDKTSIAAKAFYRLGIDPTGKSTKQVFDETAKALMGVKDETQRNALAMDIYGRNFKDIIPLMETYQKRGDEIANSPIFSTEEMSGFKEMKTGWDVLVDSVDKYSGKLLIAIKNNQDFLNKYNPVARALGWVEQESRWDQGPSGGPIGTPEDTATILKELPDEEAQARANEAYKNSIDNISDAMKDYQRAVEDVADAQEELNDINRDYARELQLVDPRDASSVRNLMMRHQWAVEDQQEEISTARGAQVEAGGNVAKAAMGAAGITINGPIYLNGDKSFERMIADQTKSMGVPNR
jgi:flagellar hook-basal body complex protein FliE